ncbi:MAG: hypothetical protein IJM21_08405 [Clostridia bacterium]|nr:hypothetical protein [Clostridia bacterium]
MTFSIPASLQLVVDDVGWFHGPDDRENGGSARTGMPRSHTAADYEALELLGRKTGMTILAAFVMGEWDPDDRLRPIPCLSRYGDRWHNASLIDREEAEKCAGVIRSSSRIEIAIHGLMHNYYKPGVPYGNSDYYYRRDGRLVFIGKDETRRRLEAFFDLLDYWDFRKPVRAFVPPNFVYRWGEIAEVLTEYGVLFASTVFADDDMEMPEGPKPVDAGVDCGVIVLDRNHNPIRWKEPAADPRGFPPFHGIFGCHWPNLLSRDPAGNETVVDRWAAYFEKAREEFDLVLSEDIAFAASQTLYRRFAALREEKDGCAVDLHAVPRAPGRAERFLLRSRKALTRGEGCTLRLRERRAAYDTYEIYPQKERIAVFP